MEISSCGVGFLVSLNNHAQHLLLKQALTGLSNMEHRGGIGKDHKLSDGAGILCEIPFKLLGYEKGSVAVATLFAPTDELKFKTSLEVFESTFAFNDLDILEYREVPVDDSYLSEQALNIRPRILQAIIKRPKHCRTIKSFDQALYFAKQLVRSQQKEHGIKNEFFFASLSCQTIVYKALTTSANLPKYYLDLQDERFTTSFAMFHRRFSTNTLSSWDKVQPFRVMAHNGEINTIEGNKRAAISREKQLGLRKDELITHKGSSDSGNLNGIVEALKYRSSIPNITEIMSILIPPAGQDLSEYFRFWSRAMEPWDGPALVTFCDGKQIGARLDRNGFRPARWCQTADSFYLASEAGCFELEPETIESRGTLYAGRSVSIRLSKGEISFNNPDQTLFYRDAHFDARLEDLPYLTYRGTIERKQRKKLFYYTEEELKKELYPMVINAKESIGSMGDTARLAAFSTIHRSVYDYFYQNFAQVTNPPLDYIREKMVTELQVYLGKKPNIFEPKELIPPPRALRLDGPILSLGQMEVIETIQEQRPEVNIRSSRHDTIFDRQGGTKSFRESIERISDNVVYAVRSGCGIIILSDRKADFDHPPIPSIFVLRAVQLKLNKLGIRLQTSIVIDSGEIRNAHQVAVLVGFGASAICPYLSLELARKEKLNQVIELFPDQKEQNLIKALESGLLRIMAKRGISVVRSYQGAELFTILGLGDEILGEFFPGHKSIMGGLTIDNLVREILKRSEEAFSQERVNNFVYKEHNSGTKGEIHSMTTKRARLMHQAIKDNLETGNREQFTQFFKDFDQPVHIRQLLEYKKINSRNKNKIELGSILKTFGCGAMSFGAISAESQRDLIKAFASIGGRSNSGEGGENPFYFTEGISASVKQIASGRFGVTAEYLISSDEIQIKMAQGAKPGEGGQLMGVKVNDDIAKARFSNTGVDLISPPPQHDIYSIEDLRQLIYELKELHPKGKVSVKLVSGHNIGAIALGVVKAGADIIQISGGDGGTGAASLMSMKHAGLPWEVGLVEVHDMLFRNGMRENIILRIDGGLQTGRDIVMAAIMGAEEFDFGKNLLVAEGCIMARVCEKNTCPAGIATHDFRFKKRYTGSSEQVVSYLKALGEDTIEHLEKLGATSLKEIVGRRDLLSVNQEFSNIIERFNLDLSYWIGPKQDQTFREHWSNEPPSELNDSLEKDYLNDTISSIYPIYSRDRAVVTRLAGLIERKRALGGEKKDLQLNFRGSAGQGFAAFLCQGLQVHLKGLANDSVGKGMSGGRILVEPGISGIKDSFDNVLIGNSCLYGATGGEFFCAGSASDRFAVRNSGAFAIVGGVGLHACEYMTGGTVIILGNSLENIGAGMTGGVIYTLESNLFAINSEYIKQVPLTEEDQIMLESNLKRYQDLLNLDTAKELLDSPLVKLVPL
jgi:glutamate synthase domain-containing protein 2/glutamate synthase domain-containing protein 1/glutamate synthase domain-containing protein 3